MRYCLRVEAAWSANGIYRDRNAYLREENRSASQPNSHVEPLYSLVTGELVVPFPATPAELFTLPGRWPCICHVVLRTDAVVGPEVDRILAALRLDGGRRLDGKRKRLAWACGVRRPM